MNSSPYTLMETRCPICKKPTNSEKDNEFPFCSERCRVTDLGNWSSEKYRLSGPALDESETENPQTPPRDTDDNKDGS